MRNLILSVIAIFIFSSVAIADNGLVTTKSTYNVSATADRFEKVLKTKGMTIFSRINHSEGAAKVGKQLRPTELIIFGNPQVGTPLMLCAQTVAIDLPQKALFWEDENGQTWLSYNDPEYLVTRHNIKGCDEVVKKITHALSNFAKAATEK